MSERPALTLGLKSKDFLEYYYLKEELVQFCRDNGLPATGGKQELTERIATFLDTGKICKTSGRSPVRSKKKITGITADSIIEENIVCSEVHRAFFKSEIGESFSFNVAFQKWLKTNAGKTYSDAVDAYYEIKRNKDQGPKVIGKQFEYNTYIRDFFEDNKGASLDDAIRCWKYKKSLKGHNKYERSDLEILNRKMILIFDLFQTLVEVENMDFNLGLKPFWNEHYKDKCSFDEIKAYGEELYVRMTDLHKSGFEFPFVKDELPLYAERFGGDPVNMNIEDEALFLSRCNKVRVCDGLREMLDILAEREIPMYVLSNSGFRADALHLMLDSNGIGRYLKKVWSSADFGKVKPSAELFNMSISEVLSQHPDASKEDIWFIGDTYETDIIGAHNAGLRTVWINRDNAAGDKGVATHQIRDITDLWKTDLALLPPCFNEIKDAILSGTGYWYPLSGKESALKPAAYSLDKIYRDGRIDLLESILEKAEITRMTAFHPFRYEHSRGSKWKVIADMKSYIYEKDDAGYNFPWIDETYYFDKSGSRIIYVSHEGTITFAGERLSGIPEAVIPDTYKINMD